MCFTLKFPAEKDHVFASELWIKDESKTECKNECINERKQKTHRKHRG